MVLHGVTKPSIRISQNLTDSHRFSLRFREALLVATCGPSCTSNQKNNNNSQNHYRKTHYNPGQVKGSMCLLMVKLTMNSVGQECGFPFIQRRMGVSLCSTKNNEKPAENNKTTRTTREPLRRREN